MHVPGTHTAKRVRSCKHRCGLKTQSQAERGAAAQGGVVLLLRRAVVRPADGTRVRLRIRLLRHLLSAPLGDARHSHEAGPLMACHTHDGEHESCEVISPSEAMGSAPAG